MNIINVYTKIIYIILSLMIYILIPLEEITKNNIKIVIVIIISSCVSSCVISIVCGNTILLLYSFSTDGYFKFWICGLYIIVSVIKCIDTVLYIRTIRQENEESIFIIERYPVIITNIDTSNTECCICLDNIELDNSAKLEKCGHIFHKHCIEQWFIVDPNLRCPMCRDR